MPCQRRGMLSFIQSYQAANDKQDRKERCVKGREGQKIARGSLGIDGGILAEGDKTGKGGDEGSRATDVDAEEQFAVIFGEFREQNGRWNVTDDLAGEGADKKRIARQQS